MELTVETEILPEGIALILLHGEADVHTCPRVKQAIGELLDRGSLQLVVNLEGLEFLDSTALGVLIGSLRRARDRNGDLKLVCENPRILRILEVAGVKRLFAIYPSTAAALAGR